MTQKERAAMQQALEALELARGSHGVMLMSNPPHDAWQYRGCDYKLAEAITALREALDHSGEANEMVAEQAEQLSKDVAIFGTAITLGGKRINPASFYKEQEQEPVLCVECGQPVMHIGNKCYSCCQKATRGLEDALKAAVPVRTKDLTDDELNKLLDYWSEDERSAYGGAWSADGQYVDMKSFAHAVIAADREKNK